MTTTFTTTPRALDDGPSVTRFAALALGLSVACMLAVAAVVNLLIYTARWDYIAWHPGETARKPPTISQALSDPRVGEPFADWMLICAPVLFAGVALAALVGLWQLWHDRPGTRSLRLRLTALGVLMLLLQAAASAGMVTLSQFRFPDHNAMHMNGSYLFFFSQALVVVAGEGLSRSLARHLPGQVIFSHSTRLRRRFVGVVIALAVAYLSLFVGKNFDWGSLNRAVRLAYVTTEPMLITAFLVYLLAWTPDSLVAIRRYLRS